MRTGIGKSPFFIFGLTCLLFFLAGIKKASLASDEAQAATEYLIEDIQGTNVQVLEEGQSKWEPAEEGQVLESGDEIKTGAGCEATLMLQSETSVRLSEKSALKVERIEANEAGGFLSRLKMSVGHLLADVKKNLQNSRSVFEIESNGVVCGVRGTAFEMTSEGDDVQTATHEGEVEVAGLGQPQRVKAGDFSLFKARKFHLLRRLDRMETQRFQKWRAVRQLVLQKRMKRIEAIRTHKRKAWIRRHPRLQNPALRNGLRKQWIKRHQQKMK